MSRDDAKEIEDKKKEAWVFFLGKYIASKLPELLNSLFCCNNFYIEVLQKNSAYLFLKFKVINI
jgi:hypothetical protein